MHKTPQSQFCDRGVFIRFPPNGILFRKGGLKGVYPVKIGNSRSVRHFYEYYVRTVRAFFLLSFTINVVVRRRSNLFTSGANKSPFRHNSAANNAIITVNFIYIVFLYHVFSHLNPLIFYFLCYPRYFSRNRKRFREK